MQYQYQRAQIAEEAFNVHAETGLTPRQLAEQRAELLEALKYTRDYFNKLRTEDAISESMARTIVSVVIANAERKP